MVLLTLAYSYSEEQIYAQTLLGKRQVLVRFAGYTDAESKAMHDYLMSACAAETYFERECQLGVCRCPGESANLQGRIRPLAIAVERVTPTRTQERKTLHRMA